MVGAGGIAAPAAIALGEAAETSLHIVDDDLVELSNLHRQLLFTEDDLGCDKGQALAAALERRFGARLTVTLHRGRALPATALALVRDAAVVIDATDNFATRFLLADACHLAAVPVVHAAAVRWHATVLAVRPEGRPCYRCLFEDIPSGDVIDCATAGVMAPVCGVAGALAADAALSVLRGEDVGGSIATYDGRTDRLRRVPVQRRRDCELCGPLPAIGSIDASRYEARC